jgi:hypothetical protein
LISPSIGAGFRAAVHNFDGLAIPLTGSRQVDFGITAGTITTFDTAACDVSYNRAPSAPTGLSPANGSQVLGLTPTFQGTHNDADGPASADGQMNAVNIEVRRVSDNALIWGSGWLAATGSTFSKIYAGPTLVSGTQYKWRARTRDNSGASNAEGAWSAYLTFTPFVNQNPTASLVSPPAGAQVGTLAPTLTIGFSDPDTATGDFWDAWQIQVRRVSNQVLQWDSNWQTATSGQRTAGQAAVAYGSVGGSPTTLINGVAYEWRARVRDSYGGVSAYTGWRAFTPALAPDAPDVVSPSGLTNTLTPAITGVYNPGTGGTETAYQYQVRQGITTIYSSGDVTGVLGTGQAYGTNNPSDTPSTPPALAWGTSYQIRIRSKDSVGAYSEWSEWIAFTTNAPPTAPSNVTPGNGAITPDTTPTITWQHNDPDGDAQTAADVELYDVTDDAFVTGYDPKTLSQATTTHDVTETLDLTHEYRVRVRTVGLAGPGAGPWSTPQTFVVADVPAVAVTSPAVDAVIAQSSLLVEWMFSGGSGTQQDFRVLLFAADGVTVLHDSGVVAGTALSYAIPAGAIRNGGAYFVRLNVRDTLSQEGVTGLVPFTASFTPPDTIEGLTVALVGGGA